MTCPVRITWRQMYRQFGADPARATDTRTVQKFRLKVLRELKARSRARRPVSPASGLRSAIALWLRSSSRRPGEVSRINRRDGPGHSAPTADL